METRAGDPGAFARFDLTRVPSPAFVVDAAKVRANLAVLRHIGDQSGARVLAALKAFSMWSVGPVVADYLDGVCASGLFEARLGREEYGGEVATYCAGYKEADLPEIARLSDQYTLDIVFADGSSNADDSGNTYQSDTTTSGK